MKRIAVSLLVLTILLLSACQTLPAPLPDAPAKLMEFPGLQWNMSPDAIMEALNLQESDLIEVLEDEEQDFYNIAVKGEALGELFGGKVDRAIFNCLDIHEGENAGTYGLLRVDVFYKDDTDMAIVQEKITERYGEESTFKSFHWEESGTKEFDVYPEKITYVLIPHESTSDGPYFYWASEGKIGDYLTEEMKNTYYEMIKSFGNTDETFQESFEAMLNEGNAAYIQMIDRSRSEESTDGTDSNGFPLFDKRVAFDGRALVWAVQDAGNCAEPIS